MNLCGPSLAEGELAKRVTIRVDSRPACQVFYVGLKGPAYLGQSSQDLEVEPPYLTDASGKPAQYTTGHLVLRAEGHLEAGGPDRRRLGRGVSAAVDEGVRHLGAVDEEELQAAGGDVRYTEFPDANHNSWDPAYSGTPALWPWLFAQKRK